LSNEVHLQVILPDKFTKEHERILTLYLADDRRLNTLLRQRLYEAIDLLSQAEVRINRTFYTFRQVYDAHIDQAFADAYLEQLLALIDVPSQSPALAAKFARQIPAKLEQANWLVKNVPQSYLLLAYCIYWWQSFARGYAFEVEIMRDLEAGEIVFEMHDIRSRVERYSQADLIVLDLLGDIKTSTYFLQVQPAGSLANDFYITRLYAKDRIRTLVVFQKPNAWQRIGGKEASLGDLNNIFDLLPQPVQLKQLDLTLIVIEYENWKEMVRSRQADEGVSHA
jgi:hypothetical protein